MPLIPGTRVGVYDVIGPLGAGGMGEVYRARDTRLHRDVALKVLPDAFAADPERRARFEREAQVLAALNHPHIAAIYGLEDAALVMELVEGETLADRLARGAVPPGDALAIARQIADALEAAHERGIVHRDLKPANICLTANGTVKVLDFGLAKLVAGPGGSEASANLSLSPTITSPAMMTAAGVLLGTAAYMSPEQARGREADKRADVWAFGCVLFEMLAGRRPFEGRDVSETLAATLMREPEWTALPRDVPPAVRRLLERCLRKDPRQRLHDIADARLELDDADRPADAPVAAPTSRVARVAPWAIAAAVLVAALVQTWRVGRDVPSAPVRFSVLPPQGRDMASEGWPVAALSPDGRRLVIAVDEKGTSRLYVRDLDRLDAVPMAGAESGSRPFFSPDGRWIAFNDRNTLKKVALDGGAAVPIVEAGWGNGTWTIDDTIIYTPEYSAGLWRVPASGGTPQKLTEPDRGKGELGHWWPQLLPDGTTVLFTAFTTPAERSRIEAYSLDTGQRRIVLEGGMHARYVDSGHLLFARGTTVMAIPFDPGALTTSGQPVPVLDSVAINSSNGLSQFSVSRTGTLSYVSAATVAKRLVWVDRAGTVVAATDLARQFERPRLSPDGRRVAVTLRENDADVWIVDLARGGLARATFAPAAQFNPEWTPDGRRLVFAFEEPVFHIYARDVNAAGDPRRLLDGPDDVVPSSISPDGRYVVFTRNSPKTRGDIWILPLDGKGDARALLQSPFDEEEAVVSPDGRWMAYRSDETGRDEIYIERFPDGGGRVQVSSSGGIDARWSSDGRELFFREGDRMMAATVSGLDPLVGRPRALFELRLEAGYDVARDGRFLAVQRDPQAPRTPVHVVVNWFEELRRKVPAD